MSDIVVEIKTFHWGPTYEVRTINCSGILETQVYIDVVYEQVDVKSYTALVIEPEILYEFLCEYFKSHPQNIIDAITKLMV